MDDLLFSGLSVAIGVGIAHGTYNFLKKVYDDKPPRKFVQINPGECFDHNENLFLDGARSERFPRFGASQLNLAGQ